MTRKFAQSTVTPGFSSDQRVQTNSKSMVSKLTQILHCLPYREYSLFEKRKMPRKTQMSWTLASTKHFSSESSSLNPDNVFILQRNTKNFVISNNFITHRVFVEIQMSLNLEIQLYQQSNLSLDHI